MVLSNQELKLIVSLAVADRDVEQCESRELFTGLNRSSLCFLCAKLCLAMALHLIQQHLLRSGLEFGAQTKT